jgi:hypothetical protein
MSKLLNVSAANLVRTGALLCFVCFVLLMGCNETTSTCEITVSGPGSLCNINYTDNNGNTHVVIIQSDSDVITIDDCDEVISVDCS